MQITSQQALARLIEGNKRFSDNEAVHGHTSPQRLREVAGGQEPYATILTCSDSRVSPEILFDCGIGELFIIRNAGNVLDETSIASVLYAVMHLATPLVMILGHQSCGAVTAACTSDDAVSSEPQSIQSLIQTIKANTGISEDAACKDADGLLKAIHDNAHMVVKQLCGIPEIAVRCSNNSLQVTSAYFSFDSGLVTIHT